MSKSRLFQVKHNDTCYFAIIEAFEPVISDIDQGCWGAFLEHLNRLCASIQFMEEMVPEVPKIEMEFEKFLKLGQEIGLEGLDLVRFAQEREAAQEKQRREHLEREDRRIEREERQKVRDHEKEMKAYELRIEQEHANGGSSPNAQSTFRSSHSAKIPKLPVFNEQTDDLDAYLRRFEQFAELNEWPEGEWGMALSALLKGKALEVYSRLPAEKARDFSEIKKALLNRFRLTDEGFRRKFRTATRETGERYVQFGDRLRGYAERWIELADVEKCYNSVIDLFVSEQIIEAADKDLALFLKERKPKDLKTLTQIADQYLEAHEWPKKKPEQVRPKSYYRSTPPLPKVNPKPSTNPVGSSQMNRRCYKCGKSGHIAQYCKTNPTNTQQTSKPNQAAGMKVELEEKKSSQTGAACLEVSPEVPARCAEVTGDKAFPFISAACTIEPSMPVRKGVVGKLPVTVLRDTGCSTVVVRRDIVEEDKLTGRIQPCILLDGTVRRVPVASIDVDTPFFVGKVEALCMDNPLYDLIIGNVSGAREPHRPDESRHPLATQSVTEVPVLPRTEEKPGGAVETRGMKAKKEKSFKPLLVAESDEKSVSRDEILLAQQEDPTLIKLWKHVDDDDPARVTGKANVSKYVKHKGLLYREFQSPKVEKGRVIRQLVVPQKYRDKVLSLAHDSPLAGHLGVKKMADKLCLSFYWPGVSGDVQRYCRSCDICQRTVSKGRVGRATLGEMPLIDTPFKRIAVDLVGPIHPVTDQGNRYILVVVDYATRYPEAVALPRIESERVAEALLEVYSRLGIPQEILTDMGTQFTSEVMREVGRLLAIKQLTTTPYHPMCNGLVERFNATLKKMLRRMCAERPRDWDRFLPALLFAYREAPQESLGFSPFELMYGRSVKGPLSILQDIWSDEQVEEEVKTTYQFVVDLRERLQSTCEMAQEELAKASKRYRKYYNAKSSDRRFKVGDKVLLLRPTDHNKLLLQWAGPFPVLKQVAKHDYVIEVAGKEKTYHANLLKLYVDRGNENSVTAMGAIDMAGVGFVVEDSEEMDEIVEVVLPPVEAKESRKDVKTGEALKEDQRQEVVDILQEFDSVFTDLPGKTNLIQHTIHLTTDLPIRSKPYPTPLATQEVIKKEIEDMVSLGVIERSESSYASPIVLVRKPDGTNRFCIDFRKLNAVTVFDPEPIPNAESLMAQLGQGRYFSKLDLSKGYWQIPIADEDKQKTAFVTAEGLYHFKVLPFGMVNAPAVFSRMMRKLLSGLDHVINYIDDILIFTETWEEHTERLREVLQRVRRAGLTARPSKCFVAFESLEFLGHVVGRGTVKPRPEKIQQIINAVRPLTKKERILQQPGIRVFHTARSETCCSHIRTSQISTQGPAFTRSLMNAAKCMLERRAGICLPHSANTRLMDDKSSIIKHFPETDHVIQWQQGKLITSIEHWRPQRIREAFEIIKNKTVRQDIGFNIS
ncbi:uncharacterized protein LOC110981615 [Acanthaster planci]|uniref:Uncharacterized protein LOC110981615 n=1 Tax=Acanthaster planci TaxID=133434 RepID=A0A8B7YP21_ACAPL|nr:uncharacterized protein LOC110981615 [Acanthaster planci]